MRVKKIELIGFKSFADRTEIHLGDGVTCIVGPNGCGKSNISDAIRWVFGERSAKLLRGTRMDDVIFSGTEFRKPTGMAEVSLTVDNADRHLAIEYGEVVFTRRLYRSGQSEYFINRTPCRLRDILNLILDTGMGSNSYSMIEQGRVDYVIQANPTERRFLIEEAAGISKYKVKKEEALRKLERTEQNLLRIRDILGEVLKNIQYAEKQARRAERYKNQFSELKRFEIYRSFQELGGIEKEQSLQESRKTGLLQAMESLEQTLRLLQEKQGEEEAVLREIAHQESERARHLFELKSELRSLSQKQDFNRERTMELDRRKVESAKEREILSASLETLLKEIREKSEEVHKVEEEFRSTAANLTEKQAGFQQSEQAFNGKKERAEKLKGLIFENANQLAQEKNEISRLRTLLEVNERNQQKRRQSLEKLQSERALVDRNKAAYQEEAASVSSEFQKFASSQQGLTSQFSAIKQNAENLANEIEDKKIGLREAASRLTLLQELEETSHSQEQKLLNSVRGEKLRGKMIRTLREVIKIKPGYEAAVEAVLGRFAQALIADDVETAQGLITEMTASHVGPFGIFIQSLVKRNPKLCSKIEWNHPQIGHQIFDVVEIDSGYQSLFEPLFQNVYVVEGFLPQHLTDLLPHSEKATLVTTQGIVMEPEARIFFRNGRLTPDQGPFQRRFEMQTLSDRDRDLKKEILASEAQRTELGRELTVLEDRLTALTEQSRDSLARKKAAESHGVGLTERLSSLHEETRVIEFEIEEAQEEITQIQDGLKNHERKTHPLEVEAKQLQEEQRSLEGAFVDFQREHDLQIHTLTREKTLLENYDERLKTLKASQGLLETQVTNTKERLQRLIEETSDSDRRLQEILSADVTLDEEKARIESEHTEAEAVLVALRGQKSYQEECVKKQWASHSETEDRLRAHRNVLHQEELKCMELSYKDKSLHERMLQTYHVHLSELKPEDYTLDLEPEALEAAIQNLKGKVEAFGPVNLLAVEEYEELKHRFDFLSAQEKDLNEARESLLEAIRKINRTTKTLFKETFEKAQSLFQEYYQVLFNGGRAELVLLEGEETEEAGIDILVRPPGKKLQHISLLSGGEKALTAMALLFALFRIKPSPMCVLDEVDAPLDEANVDRFIKVLRTFLAMTQFLIVTHNRKTIAMGDSLYGVTMEESGVSKVVSVKVTQAEAKTQAVADPVAAA